MPLQLLKAEQFRFAWATHLNEDQRISEVNAFILRGPKSFDSVCFSPLIVMWIRITNNSKK